MPFYHPSPSPALFDRPLLILQAVDAVTPNSNTALVFITSLSLRPVDRLRVLHVYNSTKSPKGAPEALAEHFKTKLTARLSAKRYDVKLVAKDSETTPTRTLVLDAIRGEHPDLVVVGFTGRKGPKSDVQIMGSSTDLSLREGNTSVLVVKTWDESGVGEGGVGGGAPPPKTFLVGFDGSLRSQEALLFTLRLAHPGRDSVVALYLEDVGVSGVAGEREGDDVEAGFKALVAAAVVGPAPTTPTTITPTLVRRPSGGKSVHALFKEEVDERGASVCVVGADGVGAASSSKVREERRVGLGSVSDAVLRHCNVNVLVYFKPPPTK